MNRNIQMMIAINYKNESVIRPLIESIANDKTEKPQWRKFARRFLAFLDDGIARFSIIVEGNDKLPFLAFSSIAIATCPGAGECKSFCYSLRAWRYPAAFFRQLQNALLIETANGQDQIVDAIQFQLNRRKYRDRNSVDFRINVDGDIADIETALFWFDRVLPKFSQLKAYGYSKSFRVLVDYAARGYQFPNNFVLNVSSGSNEDNNAQLLNSVYQLPITRGDFIAVPIANKYSAAKGEYATKAYRDEVRQSAKANGYSKVFVCPGRCGQCTGAGHACGNSAVSIPIVIGIH